MTGPYVLKGTFLCSCDSYCAQRVIPGRESGPQVGWLRGRVQKQEERRRQDETVIIRRLFGIQSKGQKALLLYSSLLFILCKNYENFNVG